MTTTTTTHFSEEQMDLAVDGRLLAKQLLYIASRLEEHGFDPKSLEAAAIRKMLPVVGQYWDKRAERMERAVKQDVIRVAGYLVDDLATWLDQERNNNADGWPIRRARIAGKLVKAFRIHRVPIEKAKVQALLDGPTTYVRPKLGGHVIRGALDAELVGKLQGPKGAAEMILGKIADSCATDVRKGAKEKRGLTPTDERNSVLCEDDGITHLRHYALASVICWRPDGDGFPLVSWTRANGRPILEFEGILHANQRMHCRRTRLRCQFWGYS